MKKILYTLCILATAALCACDDFLTVESPDQLTSEKYWRNASDAEKGLAAAYSKLEHYIETWEFAEVRWTVEAYREDIISLGKDAMNYLNWVELSKFTYTNGNSQINLYWENIYRGINYANQVIEKVPEIDMDPTYRTQITNEAYFLRAYYHMKLLLNWKEIVLRDEYIITVSPDKLAKPLSPREATWEFIVGDLTKAQALPARLSPDYLGRATSGAASAYLGFAYLTMAYETPEKKNEYMNLALTAFNKVSGYSLEKNFRGMFDGRNQNSNESVFELQCTMASTDGANYRTQMHRWIGSEELYGWDEILPSEALINEFKKEGKTATTGYYDTRAYETLYFRDDYFNGGGGDVYGETYDEWFGEDGRTVFRKLMPNTLTELRTSRVGYNIPLMRYANVMLMKAEVLNELGQTADAIPLINEVRSVHGDMPPMQGTSADAVRAQIEHERILEFPLENYRFYDLRRWGKTKAALNAVGRTFDPAKNDFYPTPLTELNSNNLIQK